MLDQVVGLPVDERLLEHAHELLLLETPGHLEIVVSLIFSYRKEPVAVILERLAVAGGVRKKAPQTFVVEELKQVRYTDPWNMRESSFGDFMMLHMLQVISDSEVC